MCFLINRIIWYKWSLRKESITAARVPMYLHWHCVGCWWFLSLIWFHYQLSRFACDVAAHPVQCHMLCTHGQTQRKWEYHLEQLHALLHICIVMLLAAIDLNDRLYLCVFPCARTIKCWRQNNSNVSQHGMLMVFIICLFFPVCFCVCLFYG